MEQLCAARSGPGCAAVASREAGGCLHVGRLAGSLPAPPAPCHTAALSRCALALQPHPPRGWARGEEEEEEEV